jgi:hypothetical protein
MIPDGIGISLLGRLALSGWGYADSHAGVNFRFTAFSEVGVSGRRDNLRCAIMSVERANPLGSKRVGKEDSCRGKPSRP